MFVSIRHIEALQQAVLQVAELIGHTKARVAELERRLAVLERRDRDR